MAVEPVWRFYPRLILEIISKHARMGRNWIAIQRMTRRIRKDPQRHAYTDQALAEVSDDETETLELFTHNDKAREQVAHTRKIAALTHVKSMEIRASH